MTVAYANLSGVRKRIGTIQALDGVDLVVYPGEIVALLGPNGAGKTTLVSILAGLRRADQGTVCLFGLDPATTAARMALGMTPQAIGFPKGLRVSEVVDMVRSHYPRPVPRDDLLERFGLQALHHRLTHDLSGGEARRLALALTFCGQPHLILLDEPTTGLDPAMRRQIWAIIRAFKAGGGAVLLTTHYMDEAAALATRVVLMNTGRILMSGGVDAIRQRVERRRVTFTSTVPPPESLGLTHDNTGRYSVDTGDADTMVRRLVEAGVPFSSLEVSSLGLEDAVLHLLETASCA